MSLQKQSLPLLWAQLEAVLTKVGDYSYFYCYIMWCGLAEALDISSCPPSLCGKSLENIVTQGVCVVWLHGNKAHNKIRRFKESLNEYWMNPCLLLSCEQCPCVSDLLMTVKWLFTKCLFDIWLLTILVLQGMSTTCHKIMQTTTVSTFILK